MIRSPVRVAAVMLVMATGLAGCGLNGTSTREEMAQARWADVQSQFSGRARLTTEIVEALKPAIALQDAGVLQDVGARAAGAVAAPQTPTDPAAFRRYEAAQRQLTRSLVQLDQVSARYPQLRSDRNLTLLNTRLDGTEGRIAVAVNDYNEAAGDYNAALGRFPTALWSGGRVRMQLFTPGTR